MLQDHGLMRLTVKRTVSAILDGGAARPVLAQLVSLHMEDAR